MMHRWHLVEGIPGKLVELDPSGRMLGMRRVVPGEGEPRMSYPKTFVPERQVASGPVVERAIAKGAVRKLGECKAVSHAEACAQLLRAAQAEPDTSTAEALSAPATAKRSK